MLPGYLAALTCSNLILKAFSLIILNNQNSIKFISLIVHFSFSNFTPIVMLQLQLRQLILFSYNIYVSLTTQFLQDPIDQYFKELLENYWSNKNFNISLIQSITVHINTCLNTQKNYCLYDNNVKNTLDNNVFYITRKWT